MSALSFAFVDNEKAIDSVEFTPHFLLLKNQGIDPTYINLLRDRYNGASSTLKLHKESDKVKLERGTRQGDNISPKAIHIMPPRCNRKERASI